MVLAHIAAWTTNVQIIEAGKTYQIDCGCGTRYWDDVVDMKADHVEANAAIRAATIMLGEFRFNMIP